MSKFSENTIGVFRAYVRRCRPVWTLTWRDCASPSIRSGVADVREEDTYFNRELAVECIGEFGRATLTHRLPILRDYIASDACKGNELVFKVPGMFNYTHRVHTPEADAFNYFLSCVAHIARHRHRLKYG